MKFKREREKKRRIIVESTENCNEKNSNEIFWIFKFKFCDASILSSFVREIIFFLRKETTLTLSVALSSILGTLESAVIILGWPALAAWWSAVAPVQSVASPFNDSTASARYSTTRTLLPRAAHIKRVYCFCNKQVGCLSRYYIIRMNILVISNRVNLIAVNELNEIRSCFEVKKIISKHFSQEFFESYEEYFFFIRDKSTSLSLSRGRISRREGNRDSVRKEDASNCIRGNLNHFL